VGTGAGNAEKDTPPQAVEWGGAGKRAGGRRFSGPRPPRNELYTWEPSEHLERTQKLVEDFHRENPDMPRLCYVVLHAVTNRD